MEIFPAIDILLKKAVRLQQGDYARATVYSDDPLEKALAFREAGAKALHVVDLDGAKSGQMPNFEIICDIIRQSGLTVQVGGGIRGEKQIDAYLHAGAKRVIIGTAAAENIRFAAEMAQKYGESVAFGVDAKGKNGAVAVRGWTNSTGENAVDFCRRLAARGAVHIIYTDISKDGMLTGANLEIYKTLVQIEGVKITASGGVTALDELKTLKETGVYGAIIGKALYAGKLDLAKAVRLSETAKA